MINEEFQKEYFNKIYEGIEENKIFYKKLKIPNNIQMNYELISKILLHENNQIEEINFECMISFFIKKKSI
jgi:hypothetical protein